LPIFDVEEGGDPIAAAEALIGTGRAGEAATALRVRLAAGRGGALARIMLVTALLAAGDTHGALEEAREARALYPNIAPVLVALGRALLAAGQLPTAIAELHRALRLDPENAAARRALAQAWLEAGEADRAMEALQDVEAAELTARARAMLAAPRSDPGYVRHLFDQFSANYDTHMRGHLRHVAPEILLGLAEMVMPGRAGASARAGATIGKSLKVLDLGCGTGLAGEVFRPLAARLDGIDLSPAMIDKARGRGLYDTLAVADLESALAAPGMVGLLSAYDLILAADTLVYLGDLSAVFRSAAARLAPGGFFLFTVEKAQSGFELGPKRRWRHGESYLREMAQNAGLEVAGLLEAAPRHEAGLPVAGYAVALARPECGTFQAPARCYGCPPLALAPWLPSITAPRSKRPVPRDCPSPCFLARCWHWRCSSPVAPCAASATMACAWAPSCCGGWAVWCSSPLWWPARSAG
jgi:predicted TPR repeat methyltransferase